MCILLVLWAVAIGVCFYRIIISPPRSGVNSDKQVDPESCSNQILTVGIAFTLNACVTITVNTLYIYSTQQGLGPSLHFFIQLSLSIFRLVYIALAFPFLARPIRNAIANVRFRFILLTINNLMIPCVVTALTSDACFQGLLIPADAVSTPYSFRTCVQYTTNLNLDGGASFCSQYSTISVDSASLVPPFTYNNQCGSVVLTSYIPVFLLGYSIQLLLPLVALMVLPCVSFGTMSPHLRNMLHGVLFPEYWLQEGDVMVGNRALVETDPRVILDTRTIFCNDMFNNLLVILTFGLCSPVLAVAVVCVVWLKMAMWVTFIGRFTRCLLADGRPSVIINHHPSDRQTKTDTDTDTDTTSNVPAIVDDAISPCRHSKLWKVSTGGVAVEQRAEHFTLHALAAVYIPLMEVLAGSFWRLVWCSAVFVALIGWDMALDEVEEWLSSLWVPIAVLVYVLLLRGIAYCLSPSHSSTTSTSTSCSTSSSIANNTSPGEKHGIERSKASRDTHLPDEAGAVSVSSSSQNPLHKDIEVVTRATMDML